MGSGNFRESRQWQYTGGFHLFKWNLVKYMDL